MIRKIRKELGADLRDRGFREVAREGGMTFLIRIGGLIAGYLFIFLISRFYGSEVLGAHTLSVTVLMMFTVAGRLGMDVHLVKHFATAHADGRWDKIFEVYRKTIIVVLIAGLVLSVLLYGFAPLIAENVFKKPMLAPWLRVISFGVFPMIMRFINSECYRGMGMNREYAYSQNVGYFLYASVILGAGLLFTGNALLPNIAFVTSLLILTFSGSYLILRRIKAHTSVPSSDYDVKEMIRESLPMMMTNSLLLISGWVITILLGIWSTQSDVGIYSVVLKISTLSTLMLMSVNSIATPRFAQLHAKGDMDAFRKFTGQATRVIFYSSFPVFLGILIFNKQLLWLFGEEFEAGSTALLITMTGQFFNVFAGSVGAILNMTGNQRVFRNIVTISTLITVALCFWLIPDYGLTGSAIAGAVFMTLWNVISTIYIRIKLKVNSFYNPFGGS